MKLLRAAGLYQRTIAEIYGVNQSTVCRLTNGYRVHWGEVRKVQYAER